MPEMDGPTLLGEMRKRNPDLKMIFVSGYAEDAFEKNLPERGQFAFLAKPFTLKQLVAAVRKRWRAEQTTPGSIVRSEQSREASRHRLELFYFLFEIPHLRLGRPGLTCTPR